MGHQVPAKRKAWAVEIVQQEGRSEGRFVHRKTPGSEWVWDVQLLPESLDSMTEAEILDELYGVVLAFLERRSGG